ncbi:MAG: DUF3365 domain-containing protein [Nitrospinae bacterium]|nr:DUF3365 domain-containing protein [Nitrospinota bacterium]
MKISALSIVLILFFLNLLSPVLVSGQNKNSGISARIAADLIHAVIEAGRTTYSEHIVEHLNEQNVLTATENWKQEKSLPLPAQFLAMSSQFSNSRGIGMKYRLLSLWPINKNNSPATASEKLGLEEVAKNPNKPFTWIVPREGRWYFEAIYPDKAVSNTCVSCHNQHPNSPKTDFKKGDVLGGIIIDLPLGRRSEKNADEKFLLEPEVVADYIHSVLESDRTIYSKHIVDRLTHENILEIKENWADSKSIMLPAQFLLNTADLIQGSELGLSFWLISHYPINLQNRPANEFEAHGLENVEVHPIRPFTQLTQVGNKKYFQAIYADIASSPGCVNCHNHHPNSPKKDFKVGDVMGGISLNFPIKQ